MQVRQPQPNTGVSMNMHDTGKIVRMQALFRGNSVRSKFRQAQQQQQNQTSAQQLVVTAPPGVQPGQQISITTPSGQQMMVAVPPGVHGGQQFRVNIPNSQSNHSVNAAPMNVPSYQGVRQPQPQVQVVHQQNPRVQVVQQQRQPQQMQLTVPPGVMPGQSMQFRTPDGRTLAVPVPASCYPGSKFLVNV